MAQKGFNEEGLPTVKIDLDKGTVSGEFPFDEYIKIQVTSKENKLLEDLSIFKVVYVRKTKVVDVKELKRWIRKKERKKKRDKAQESKPVVFSKKVEPITINIKSKEKSPNLYEGIIQPLLPDRSYNLIFTKKLNSRQINVFYEVLNLIANGKKNEASILFNKKIKSLDVQSEPQMPVSVMSSFEYLRDTLSHQLQGILSLHSKALKDSPSEVSAPDIEKYIGMLTTKKIPSSDFSQTMFGYTKSGGKSNYQVLHGLKAIGSDTIVNVLEIQKRRKNLKMSYGIVKKLDKNFIDLISHYAANEELGGFYREVILNLKNSLRHNDSIMNILSKKSEKLVSQYYSYSTTVTNNSISKQDDDGGLAYLVPDIGFVNAWGKDQVGEIEYVGRPYLGLNWHVNGYNKNKKLSQLAKKRFWSRFSVSAGITLGSIDEGGYKDLFNGLSVSTGINIRAAKNVRLGIGSLILRYDRNPILVREGMAFLPYFSISFDNKFFGDFAIFNKIFN
ncbi:hypothetical protein [Spongiivirga citrea]|uniref:hypothetical protein n=1 Tax=Spongiivirga citrea TaxID=1481457 RepID=UPI0013DBD4DA|nr:hypothetical protein [Spongiivirga citrea]